MGKEVDGSQHTIMQSTQYIAHTIALWIILATRGYQAKIMKRIIGKLIWATRPGRAAMPFLHGPMAWLHYGPEQSKYAPKKVLRSLAEAIAISCQKWKPIPTTPHQDTIFVDAAEGQYGYVAAIWSPTFGTRIWHLPSWIITQQGAELAAIEAGIKIAAYKKLTSIHLVADNMAAIYTTIKFGSALKNHLRARHVRRIAHLLRWSKLKVNISWICSEYNPADCPSRYWKYTSEEVMQAHTIATYNAMQQCQRGQPHHIGWAYHRA